MGDKKRSGRRKKRTFSGAAPKKKSKMAAPMTPVANAASSAKIGENLSQTPLNDTEKYIKEGFILIDSSILCENLSKLVKCHQCGSSNVECQIDRDAKQGLAHRISLKCDACEESVSSFETSKKTDEGKSSTYEVNIRMVSFVRGIGKSYDTITQFSTYFNSPLPMTRKSYQRLLKRNHAVNKAVALDSMKAAAAEVKTKVGRDCTVSVDGTWQRRGHASHHGIVSVISSDTGKCLDAEAMSNICHGCVKWQNADKQSERYLKWRADHKCSMNHTGTANSMESVGAVRIFGRSELFNDLRYVNYLGDGDSSAFKTVADSKPYDCDIQKLECIGHVQKRVGARLRKLKTNMKGKKLADGKGIGGLGRLTKMKIDVLQNYFGLAIRQNTGNLIDMQNNLMASLYHVASTDENPNHHKCPSGDDTWCKFNKDPNFKHKHGLPGAILDIIEPIYDDLTDASLLAKCLHGMTQNNNECLNKLIWDRCPKEIFVGNLVIEDGLYSAISYFNDGGLSVYRLLEGLKLNPGYYTTIGLRRSDNARIYHSRRKSLDESKSRRKIIRGKKKHFQDTKEAQEGDTYSKGGH
ncbi:uncharacterized protein LOC141914130 [Tubulanus polymorphus]|uniref:uncharacterized protein LOC141914130 n=1 Tax=Tubulanus polymorphus TaxID=672921 RepID=UPI003DA2439D